MIKPAALSEQLIYRVILRNHSFLFSSDCNMARDCREISPSHVPEQIAGFGNA